MTEITLTSEISVDLIQAVGNDDMIAHAAMVSTKGISADKTDPEKTNGLIRYLIQNRHGTPFEHGSMTVRVHAPIKVWREWHRHRIGWSYNEESGRYKQLDPIFWCPPIERRMIRPIGFKSARPAFAHATEEEYSLIKESLRRGYQQAYSEYEYLLSLEVDRGLARDVLGVGIYSACYCTANPRSIMAFLELRTEKEEAKRPSKPLWEIAHAAGKLEQLFADRWPITYKAWIEAGRTAP